MFTGIVEAVGTVKALRKGAHSAIITVEAPQILDDVHLGDSIAVNGVCLTVTAFTAHTFDADIMHETGASADTSFQATSMVWVRSRASRLTTMRSGSPSRLIRASFAM